LIFALELNDSELLKNLASLPFCFVVFVFWFLYVMIVS